MRKLFKMQVSNCDFTEIISGYKRTLLAQDERQSPFDTLSLSCDLGVAEGSILDTIRPHEADSITDGMVLLMLGSNWEEEEPDAAS